MQKTQSVSAREGLLDFISPLDFIYLIILNIIVRNSFVCSRQSLQLVFAAVSICAAVVCNLWSLDFISAHSNEHELNLREIFGQLNKNIEIFPYVRFVDIFGSPSGFPP